MGTASDVQQAAATLREFALGLPGAYEDFPWGERVIKVNKKIFFFLGVEGGPEDPVSFSLKLPASAPAALSLPFTAPTGYGLGKAGWVSFRYPPGERPPLDLLLEWVEESYRTVAPKKFVAQLDATMRR